MFTATVLLPDFLMIMLGFVLARITRWGTDFWSGLEKLVYYVLFPALLFYGTARAPLDFATTGKLVQAALIAVAAAIALGWLAKPLFRPAPMVFESSAQTAFRFNSYVALAVSARLAGDDGTALMALIIGFAVPLCNAAAVHALVHQNGGLLKELLKNPLLVATVTGLLFNLADLTVPDIAASMLARMGNASIALGLMMVGAGLKLTRRQEAKGLSAYLLAVKLLVMPAVAYVAGRWLELPPLQFLIVMTFAAMPTASSCYVLAVRMGGNGALVAYLVSASTLLSIFTLPLWLTLAR